MLDTRTLLHSLSGTLCPACGKLKKPRQTFCYKDYMRLPKVMRDALWAYVGEGYEQAVAEALKCLNVESPHWPPPPASTPAPAQ